MQHYYLNLAKDNTNLSLEKNIEVSYAIRRTAEEVFSNFETYLKNVLRSSENKEIKAKWRKLNAKNQAKLQLIGKLFEVENKVGLYKIINPINEADINFEETLYYWINKEKKNKKITKEEFDRRIIRLEATTELTNASWCGEEISLKPYWNTIDEKLEGILLRKDNEKSVVYIENGKCPNANYKEYDLKSYINFKSVSELIFNEFEGEVENENSLTFSFPEHVNTKQPFSYESLKFKLEKIHNNKENDFHIQLLEIDEEDNSDFDSPLRFFFDDDITIKDGKGKIEYQKIEGKEEDYTMLCHILK